MKTAWVACSVILMLSCGSFLRDSSNPGRSTVTATPAPTAKACKPCPRQEAMTALIDDLEQCEAEVDTITKTVVKVKQVPVEKVTVKTVNKCDDAGPEIQPVPSTECMPGKVCLDDEGQRVLIKNMAAYEAWVQRCKAK